MNKYYSNRGVHNTVTNIFNRNVFLMNILCVIQITCKLRLWTKVLKISPFKYLYLEIVQTVNNLFRIVPLISGIFVYSRY